MGNKTRLAKELKPILMENLNGNNFYCELFAGACGMIQAIDYPKRFANDYNPFIVALMKSINYIIIKPEINYFDGFTINEELYKEVKVNQDKYPLHLIGLLAFGLSFGGKYWGGYARGGLTSKGLKRDHAQETLRNLLKLRSKLKEIKFVNKSYLDVYIPNGSVLYCDIPYKNSTKYNSEFNYDIFYSWAIKKSENNFVYISEYNMPKKFKCIWEKPVKVGIHHKLEKHSNRTERLFTIKN